MSGIFDNAEIDIPCKNCRRKTKKAIGWIKVHSQLTCRCGTVIDLDADELRREIARLESEFAKLERTLNSPKK